MKPPPYTADDFAHSPFLVFYEVTRACDLVCQHCRACAQPRRHPKELPREQSIELLQQLATFPKPPLLVFTGGDPFKREDLAEMVEFARRQGLTVALTPSATPLVTAAALQRLQQAGLHRLAFSLDGADARTHDTFRGTTGSFARTLELLTLARQLGLPLQVNTTITQRNVDQIDAMADMLADRQIALWSVFFLVPVGRGLAEQRVTPMQYEYAFARLWHHARMQPFAIKTTEAPHYRRFVLQRAGDPQGQRDAQRAPLGVNDGKGVMFVSHTGQIFPSGFLPLECGRFPRDSVVDVYQHHPTFRALRDPDRLEGKCGTCEYRHVCGGSRARAYAVTRNPLAAEPDCLYMPDNWKERLTCSA
ncbi:MAG: TIGR04053 family radical SAM/SPASM domain-containing protein [Phycisphaeraceae bacterium]